MEDNKQIFNIYCDESRVENPESSRMVIGALFILRKNKPRLAKKVKKIFKKYDFKYELKWTKTNKLYLNFYKELIDFFISEELFYRCIVVDKNKVQYDVFHDNDQELAFFKFYYLMLRPKLLDNNLYYISADKKPTRDKNRMRALHAFLDSHILLHKQNCGIKHFQSYNSEKNVFIQIADYLTGLMGFACNEYRGRNNSKEEITKYLKLKIKKENLCSSTVLTENKFNVFIWNKDEKG